MRIGFAKYKLLHLIATTLLCLAIYVCSAEAQPRGSYPANCNPDPPPASTATCDSFDPNSCGVTDCVSPEYIASISDTESGGYYNCTNSLGVYRGRYQFWDETRANLCANHACLPCVSDSEFSACPALQDAYFQMFNADNWRIMTNCGATAQVGNTVNGVQITPACLLAMAHLGGPGGSGSTRGACGFVMHGNNPCDAYGTCLSDYCQRHGGVNAFTGTGGTCAVPPPGTAPPPSTNPSTTGTGSPSTSTCDGNVTPPTLTNSSGGSPCASTCTCTRAAVTNTATVVMREHENTRCFITQQMKFHEAWFFNSNYDGSRFYLDSHDGFFELHILPALMMMTEQLVTNGMQQMFILGTFFDAKVQLETQRLIQEKAAKAHKDYHPSFGMCVIGTNVRSMAAADRNGELTSFVLSQRAQDRQLGMRGDNAAKDDSVDREGRIRQVQARYCDPRDNSGDLGALCTGGKSNNGTINKDVDYTRTIDSPRTLDIDFFNAGSNTNDEQDVLALSSNLFSHETLTKPTRQPSSLEKGEGVYQDMRALIAKRSVAQNSFNAIVGMKTAGTSVSTTTLGFTERVLEQFGITDQLDRQRMLAGTRGLGGTTPGQRPSYYAQLEILAQKIYQDPEFFTNLYDTPANVTRKSVAMQAVNLMLERDMHKNELRSEMVMSVWLELELMKYQNDIQNKLNGLQEKFEEN